MHLLETVSGKRIEVKVEAVSQQEFALIRQLGQFLFDWTQLKEERVYKLIPDGASDMAGLMALIDHAHPEFGFIEIKLIESAKENVGKNKKYERVAGTLLAFACKEAFKLGYDGTVFLIPKTGLLDHYIQKYGFKQAGRGLCLDLTGSMQVINTYL